MKSILYSGKFENHIRVSTLEELAESVFTHIGQWLVFLSLATLPT
jgi:hypothetical protein